LITLDIKSRQMISSDKLVKLRLLKGDVLNANIGFAMKENLWSLHSKLHFKVVHTNS